MEQHSEKALKDFLSEAEDILEEMGQDVLSVERAIQKGASVNPETVNTLFRGAHSLKGVSGMFGFSQLSQIGHQLEDLLDQLRLGKIVFDEDVLDFLLSGIETLRGAVSTVSSTGSDVETSISDPFAQKVTQFISQKSGSSQDDILANLEIDAEIISVLTEYEEHRLKENVRSDRYIFRISVAFPLLEFDERLTAATDKVKKNGELITTLPSQMAADPDQIAFDLLVGTPDDEEKLKSLLAESNPEIKLIAKKKSEFADVTADITLDGEADAESLRSITKTVRVDIARIDQISNIVGELVLIKSTIYRLTDEIKQSSVPTALSIELGKQSKVLDRKLSELQQSVMDVRMVPLRQVFDKLNRVIRKTSKDLDKEIELNISGADTELDKLLIEDLADPLMHIVRNAIDHGIESADERKNSGKPMRANLSLSAYQKGNHVAIEVNDDGKGIDTDAVKKRAVEKNLIREDQEISREEIFQLLFEPGFSTKSEVTEISGRGVGLDVVKNNIASMGGLIDIESTLGEGTTFLLTLPITLAIIQALMVEVCGKTFAIPLNAVLESMVITDEQIETVESREVMHYRDFTLPLIRLENAFKLDRKGASPEQPFVVVVGLAEKRMGLLVDRMRGQQDVVIKSVSSILKDTPGIAGATDMGDTQPVLVLDVASIIEDNSRHLHV